MGRAARSARASPSVRRRTGQSRKVIVFTEHRDTLNYLQRRSTQLLGKREAVVAIHGGVALRRTGKHRSEFTHRTQM